MTIGDKNKMKEKNKKILIPLIAVVFFAAAVFFIINKKASDKTASNISTATIEKKEEASQPETEPLKNIKGQIKSVDISGIKVLTEEKEEIFLKISQEKAAHFFESTKKKEGGFTNKEIGLLDLPLNKDAEIQFNSQTNELRMIIIIK
jgi:hypothetical protein